MPITGGSTPHFHANPILGYLRHGWPSKVIDSHASTLGNADVVTNIFSAWARRTVGPTCAMGWGSRTKWGNHGFPNQT